MNNSELVETLMRTVVISHFDEIRLCNKAAEILKSKGILAVPSSIVKYNRRNKKELLLAFEKHGLTVMDNQ